MPEHPLSFNKQKKNIYVSFVVPHSQEIQFPNGLHILTYAHVIYSDSFIYIYFLLDARAFTCRTLRHSAISNVALAQHIRNVRHFLYSILLPIGIMYNFLIPIFETGAAGGCWCAKIRIHRMHFFSVYSNIHIFISILWVVVAGWLVGWFVYIQR